jgi:hypothetical protein
MLASNGYRELGMFEDAAQTLEEIEPKDKSSPRASRSPPGGQEMG